MSLLRGVLLGVLSCVPHQWDSPVLWLHLMPGSAQGHGWGCLQGEGEGVAVTGVSQIPLDLTGQVSGDKTAALTASCSPGLSCLLSKPV